MATLRHLRRRTKVRVARASAIGTLLVFLSYVALAEGRQSVVDHVVVYKHERRLVLLSQANEIRSYRVALGGEPIGPKMRQGDHRTPEGSYILDSQSSNSRFYKAFHISYPGPKDIAAARKLGVSPGGDIMLHGLPKKYAWVGKAQTLHDWTDGCMPFRTTRWTRFGI
jgi:murein L,D-transpeptidase YafK